MKSTSLRLSLLAALATLPVILHAAPVSLSGTTTYTQNFDSLANAANNGNSTSVWADGITVPGWWLYRAGNGTPTGFAGTTYTYRVADGTVAPTVGIFHSIGGSGSTDRALGGPSTTAQGEMSAMAIFENTGTAALDLTNVKFSAEVRRANGTAANVESIFAWWRKTASLADMQAMTTAVTSAAVFPASVATAPTSHYLTGWNRLNQFDFTYSNTVAGAVVNISSGYDAAPATAIRIYPGEFFSFRWANINDGGVDAIMGIDDVQLTFTEVSASLAATVSNVVRNNKGTPLDPADDTVTLDLSVTGAGAVNPAGWTISAPPALAGTTGTYMNMGGALKNLSVPIAEFTGATHLLSMVIEDQGAPATTTTATATVEWCALTATASGFTIADGGTPGNSADDTVSYSVTAAGTWTGTDFSVDTTPAQMAAYGNSVVIGPVIAGSRQTLLFTDSADSTCTTTLIVTTPGAIGINNASGIPAYLYSLPSTGVQSWTFDGALRQISMNSGVAPAKVFRSEIASFAGISGAVKFSAILDTRDTSSGFEPADTFLAQLILNDGAVNTTINLITPHDTDLSGVLQGTELAVTGGSAATPNLRSLPLSYVIPDNIVSAQLVVTGLNNSASETMTLHSIVIEQAPPGINAAVAGTGTINHQNTPFAGDDTFTEPVNVFPVNTGASSGWFSNEVPGRSGLYSDPNPVSFGPYPMGNPPFDVTINDSVAFTATATFTITPPVPALTVSAPTNIMRIEHGPGPADDDISFSVTITGNAGPSWTASGATPGAGAYGAVTFTIPAPLPASPATVTITDVSYPAATQAISIPLPARYLVGRKDFGGGLEDVFSDPALTPAPEWVNSAAARTLTMTAGIAADSIVASEVINLSGTGMVYFTANLRASETSVGSNFETTDRFKAELVIDGGTAAQQVINLISAWDTGNGSPAVGAAAGPNGLPNGYLNGYTNIAVAPAVAPADYNNNRERDEFNLATGNPPARPAAAVAIANDFPLSYTIPASANFVQLKIYGAGAAGSETFLVSGVLFSTTPLTNDTDGDGVSNDDELIMGTSPNDPNDVLRLSQNAGNPNQLGFLTRPGSFYRVYVSDDTDGAESTHLATWKDAGLPTIRGDGNPASFSITLNPAEARRFYRLHVMTTDGPLNDGVWPAAWP